MSHDLIDQAGRHAVGRLAIFAARYGHPRNTGGPLMICNALRQLWPQIVEADRGKIVKEMREAIDTGEAKASDWGDFLAEAGALDTPSGDTASAAPLSCADQAINHILRQMQRDGRLAYLLGWGSESWRLLTQACAEQTGQPAETISDDLWRRMRPERVKVADAG